MARRAISFNPRLTDGGGGGRWLQPPFRFFPVAPESDPWHIGNLFYILCCHFDEKKNGGTTLPGGRVAVKVRG